MVDLQPAASLPLKEQAFFLWDVICGTSLPIEELEIVYEEWWTLFKESPGSEIGYLWGIVCGTNLHTEVKELVLEGLYEIKDRWGQCAPLAQPVPPTQSVFLAQPLPIKSIVHMESDPRFLPPSVPSVMPSLAVTSAPPPVESVPPVIESVVSSDQPTLAFETVEPVPQPITQLISGVQTLTERENEKKEPIHNGTTLQ